MYKAFKLLWSVWPFLPIGCATCPGAGIGWRFEVNRPSIVSSAVIAQPGASEYRALPLGSTIPPLIRDVELEQSAARAQLGFSPSFPAPPAPRSYTVPPGPSCGPATLDDIARLLLKIDARLSGPERIAPPRAAP